MKYFNHHALRANRYKLDYSQSQLAETMGCSQQIISRWERGIDPPSDRQFKKLAKVFKVSVTELRPDVENQPFETSWTPYELHKILKTWSKIISRNITPDQLQACLITLRFNGKVVSVAKARTHIASAPY